MQLPPQYCPRHGYQTHIAHLSTATCPSNINSYNNCGGAISMQPL